MSAALRIVFRNLVLLLFAILPLWFLLAWLTGGHGGAQNGSLWSAFAVGYVFVVLPLLVAGALQQLLLLLCVRVNLRSRWITISTVAVIPLVMGLISAPLNVQFSTRFAVATLFALVAFALSMKLPAETSPNSATDAMAGRV